MTRTGSAATPDFDERTESFFDWIQTHIRQISIAGLVIVALGLGAWLYRQSRVARAKNASISLLNVAQTIQQGNLPLAQSDLEKLITRYSGTQAAEQASLELATIHYEKGEFDKGIAVLEKLAASGDDPTVVSLAENGIAAGYEGLSKFAEAAAHYRAAAEKSRFESDRSAYLANAARAYAFAGNLEEAKKIWRELLEKDGSEAAEARVRLGELEARPAGSA